MPTATTNGRRKQDTPELRAMRTLAEKYSAQFQKLLQAESETAGGSTGGTVTRLPRRRNDEQTGPVMDLDGNPIADANGTPLQRGDRVQLKDGGTGEVKRLDRRTRRAVVLRDDDGKLIAAIAHGTTSMPAKRRPGRPRKNQS